MRLRRSSAFARLENAGTTTSDITVESNNTYHDLAATHVPGLILTGSLMGMGMAAPFMIHASLSP